MQQKLEYKTLPTRFLTLDGQPVRPEPVAQDDYVDLAADFSIPELRAHGEALFKHAGIDKRPPVRIATFEA